MTIHLFQMIADKAEALVDHKVRFGGLIERAETAREGGQTISLPEFEAFGWGRLEEFLNRFEDSLNSPLLEKARGTLENSGVVLSSQMIDKLKAGLAVRREKLVEIVEQTANELKKINIAEVQEKTKQDIEKYLEEGKWDDLVGKVSGWHQLEKQLTPIAKEKNKATLMYNAVFDLALQEGPQSKVVLKLKELENTVHGLGGVVLKQRVRSEAPESPAHPLADVESNLSKIAQKKEEIRQLKGEDIQLDKLIQKDTTLKGLIGGLEKEYGRLSESFEKENRRARDLLTKHNSMAVLLKEAARSLPDGLDMKRVKILISQLETDISKLSTELKKSLTSDAQVFIENIISDRVPKGWEAERILSAIQELLKKGFSFEVKRRE